MLVRESRLLQRIGTRVCTARLFSSSSNSKNNAGNSHLNQFQYFGNWITRGRLFGNTLCNNTVVLRNFEKFCQDNPRIQKPNLCLFEVLSMIIDFNKDTLPSFLAGLTSTSRDQPIISTHPDLDTKLRYFICTHLFPGYTRIHPRVGSLPVNEFVERYIRHAVLSKTYLSAQSLQKHFEETQQPVYVFLNWGDTEDKVGYSYHAIVVYGVDTEQNVWYYDVSDKLPSGYGRLRKMSIVEFNNKRILNIFFGSAVFYKEAKIEH